jgi:broad specificity phosphatase PhoE
MIEIVFETHSITEDNERGVATGWLPGRLSAKGREAAAQLGARRIHDNIGTVFASDLARAVETATIAFAGTSIPVLHDWRLRECNYGRLNGMAVEALQGSRLEHLDHPYPGGESWCRAVERVGRYLDDLQTRWDGERVLVIGHTATRWAFDHLLAGRSLHELLDSDFRWQEGWEYRMEW